MVLTGNNYLLLPVKLLCYCMCTSIVRRFDYPPPPPRLHVAKHHHRNEPPHRGLIVVHGGGYEPSKPKPPQTRLVRWAWNHETHDDADDRWRPTVVPTGTYTTHIPTIAVEAGAQLKASKLCLLARISQIQLQVSFNGWVVGSCRVVWLQVQDFDGDSWLL